MSHGMCGGRRPVSQLHSDDDVPELMRRAMRSLVRAEELKDLAPVSDAEHDALRAGFLNLVRRYVVQLREEGKTEACVANHLREALDDSLMPCSVRHHGSVMLEEAERCVLQEFAAPPATPDGFVPAER